MPQNGCQGKENIPREATHTFLLCLGRTILALLYVSRFHVNRKRLFQTDSDNSAHGKGIFRDEDRAVFINQLSRILL